MSKATPPQNDLPNLGAPAMRALILTGFSSLEKVSKASEKDLLQFHGVGSKAIRILNDALKAKELTFKRKT